MHLSRILFLTLLLAFAALSLSLTGCQPEDGSSGASGMSTVTLAFTDAASDELESFEVEITSIRLRRLSGARTTVLQTPVVVDLVTLSDLSEILRVLELPVAWYVGGDITFNWNSARARIRGQASDANLVDSSGLALTGLASVGLNFEGLGVILTANRHRVLEFDFDLDRSIFVDATANELSVAPSILVRWDRNDPKTLVTFGEIASMSVSTNSFTTTIQRPNRPSIGQVECLVTGSTVYQINGTPYTGSAGLLELEALGLGARVQTYGFVDPNLGSIRITYVEAGVGTWGGPTAVVQGEVRARSGGAGSDPVLTVRGRSASSTGRAFMLNTDFTVNLSSASTQVIRRGAVTPLDTDDINVGQTITVYGNLAGTTMSANSASDLVRLNPVRIYGFANANPSGGQVNINLSRIWLRNINLFDFDVSGSVQANPSSFSVAATVSTAGVSAGTALEFRGFFVPVNQSGADFEASSLTNLDLTPWGVRVRYSPTSSTAISSIGSTQIELDTSSAQIAVYDKILLGTNPLPTNSPKFRSKSGFTIFAILRNGEINVYLDFNAFSADLELKTNAGGRIFTFGGVGDLNLSTNTLTASLIIVTMN